MFHLDDDKRREADFTEFGSRAHDAAADISLDDASETPRARSDSEALFAAARPAPRDIALDLDEPRARAPQRAKPRRERAPAPEIELAPEATTDGAVFAPAPSAFSLTAFIGALAALSWLVAAIALPISYYGVEGVAALHPTVQAGLAALAFAPTILIWLGAAAVGEAAKVGTLARELTKLTREAMAPVHGGEGAAKRLTLHVRTEIETLNAAVNGAFERLASLEGATARNARLFEETILSTADGADALTRNLARERDAFANLNSDLKLQSETLANTVGRQVRLMREASKLVKSELADAEGALDAQLNGFRDTAALIGAHAGELADAAEIAGAATGQLDETLVAALGTLAEATKLTDAARQSTECAVMAANATASAVRETTQRSIGDAKRVADLIRSETAAMHEMAAQTLATLQAAAEAAQAATRDARGEAEASVRRPIPAPRPQRSAAPERSAALKHKQMFPSKMSGAGRWSNLAPIAANADQDLVQSAFDLVAEAGVTISDELQGADLDAVAVASRQGPAARRRAVLDAAAIAVTRLGLFLRRNPNARETALAFRARPDLAKADRLAGGADVMRVYLLIDSALGG